MVPERQALLSPLTGGRLRLRDTQVVNGATPEPCSSKVSPLHGDGLMVEGELPPREPGGFPFHSSHPTLPLPQQLAGAEQLTSLPQTLYQLLG